MPVGKWKKVKALASIAGAFNFSFDEKYKEEGNLDFHTEENLRKRAALKDNDEIQNTVAQLWECQGLERDTCGNLVYQCYQMMMLLIHQCLIATTDINDMKKYESGIRADWLKDLARADPSDSDPNVVTSTRHMALSYWRFYESVFELADTWSCEIDPSEYAGFVHHVVERITKTDVRSGKLVFRAMHEVEKMPGRDEKSYVTPCYVEKRKSLQANPPGAANDLKRLSRQGLGGANGHGWLEPVPEQEFLVDEETKRLVAESMGAGFDAETQVAFAAATRGLDAATQRGLAGSMNALCTDDKQRLVAAMEGMDAATRKALVQSMAAMSDSEKAAFVQATAGMDQETRKAMVQSMAGMTAAEKAAFVAATAGMDAGTKKAYMESMQGMNWEERSAFVAATEGLDAETVWAMVGSMAGMTAAEKAAFVQAAVGMDAESREALMEAMGSMSAEQKAAFLAATRGLDVHALKAMQAAMGGMTAEERIAFAESMRGLDEDVLAAMVAGMDGMSATERVAFARTMQGMDAEAQQAMAASMAGMTAEEKAQFVQAMQGLDVETRRALAVSMAGLSAEDRAAYVTAMAGMNQEARRAMAQVPARPPARRPPANCYNVYARPLNRINHASPRPTLAAQSMAGMTAEKQAAFVQATAGMDQESLKALMETMAGMTDEEKAAFVLATQGMDAQVFPRLVTVICMLI